MRQAIGEVLPFAIGVAVVPIPVIAVILMLFSERARVNGPVFLGGWVVGLTAAFLAVYWLADAGDAATDSTASDTVSWLRVALGVFLLALAVRQWRRRPPPGAEPALPKWIAGVDRIEPVRALGLGLALSALNPKNLVLVVGAAAGLAQLGVETRDALAALAVFVVVGSLSVCLPVAYFFLGGERARRSLDELRLWLGTHGDAIMAVLFLVFGVVLIANGIEPVRR